MNNMGKISSLIRTSNQLISSSPEISDATIKDAIGNLGSELQKLSPKDAEYGTLSNIRSSLTSLVKTIKGSKDSNSNASIFNPGTTKAEENLFLLKSAITDAQEIPPDRKKVLINHVDKSLTELSKSNEQSYFSHTEEKEKAYLSSSRISARNPELYPEIKPNNFVKVQNLANRVNMQYKRNDSEVMDAYGKKYTKINDTVHNGNCGLQASSQAFNLNLNFPAMRQKLVVLSQAHFSIQEQREAKVPDENKTIAAYHTVFGGDVNKFKLFMMKSITDLTGLRISDTTKKNLQVLQQRLNNINKFEDLTIDDCNQFLKRDLGIEMLDNLQDKLPSNKLQKFYQKNKILSTQAFKSTDFIKMQEAYKKVAIEDGNWLNLNELKMLALSEGFLLSSNIVSDNPHPGSITILKFDNLLDQNDSRYIANNSNPLRAQNNQGLGKGTHWVAVNPLA